MVDLLTATPSLFSYFFSAQPSLHLSFSLVHLSLLHFFFPAALSLLFHFLRFFFFTTEQDREWEL
jgi:hypothetical protein